MILAVGTDLVDITRIEKTLRQFDARFIKRVFTPTEIALAESRKGAARAATYARRFAAKEAAAKALGLGIKTIKWTDIETLRDADGKPLLLLHGAAQKRLASLLPEGCYAALHLSLSDEPPLALAFVVIEARPL